MILSGGRLVSMSGAGWWPTSSTTYELPLSMKVGERWASYGAFYRSLPWVAVCVNKRANGTARLPLVVYRRGKDGRQRQREHPYARLLATPNPKYDRYRFWTWTASMYDVYGEAMWAKLRRPGEAPRELWPMHPGQTRMKVSDSGEVTYCFWGSGTEIEVREADVVHFRRYNPEDPHRGMSPLEPLRSTLENEDAARRATSSFWQKGARPAVALTHPAKLSDAAADRLKLRWDQAAAGASNTGATVVLEEGMDAKVLSLSAEEAQYIESEKLNAVETCAVYDIPPTVVGILDNATFSNVTEQLRSFYRDTMAPLLNYFEAVLDHQLRPDFSDAGDIYAEFLMDEVLRGDFEQRAAAKQKAINSGQMTPAEARAMENLPFIEGSDRLLINSTMVPLDTAGESPEAPETLPAEVVRTVMGRLSRPKSLDEIDPQRLVNGLNGHTKAVLGELDEAKSAGESVEALRLRIQGLAPSVTVPETPS